MELSELLKAGLLVLEAQPSGLQQVVGDVFAEDLEGALDPCAGRDGRPRGAAQVGVVEIGEAVGGGTHLTAHPAVLPGQDGLVGAEPGEHRRDGVAVPDHDPVDTAHLARLRRDAHATRSADEGERSFRAGAGDLEGHRPSGLGEGAVREEGAAPGCDGDVHAAADHLDRKTADGTTTRVDQPGLACQRLTVADEADDIARTAAKAAAGDDDELAGEPEQVSDRRPQPARCCAGVEFRLDDNATAGDVEAVGEPEQCGHLGLAELRLRHLEGGQLGLHLLGHCHLVAVLPFNCERAGGVRLQTHDPGIHRRQQVGVMPRCPVPCAYGGENELRPQ